jgi:hypothetical protein
MPGRSAEDRHGIERVPRFVEHFFKRTKSVFAPVPLHEGPQPLFIHFRYRGYFTIGMLVPVLPGTKASPNHGYADVLLCVHL